MGPSDVKRSPSGHWHMPSGMVGGLNQNQRLQVPGKAAQANNLLFRLPAAWGTCKVSFCSNNGSKLGQ